MRESATSLTSGIGSHLLPQPPMLVRSAPSHLAAVFYDCFRRSKEIKKKRGARARRASGYRMLCGAARPPRSSWGRQEVLQGSSERSRPLDGLAALILRASAAFRALRQRRERSRRAAPPVSARIAGGGRIAVSSVTRPRHAALARGPRGRTRLVVTNMTQLFYVFLAVFFSPRG